MKWALHWLESIKYKKIHFITILFVLYLHKYTTSSFKISILGKQTYNMPFLMVDAIFYTFAFVTLKRVSMDFGLFNNPNPSHMFRIFLRKYPEILAFTPHEKIRKKLNLTDDQNLAICGRYSSTSPPTMFRDHGLLESDFKEYEGIKWVVDVKSQSGDLVENVMSKLSSNKNERICILENHYAMGKSSVLRQVAYNHANYISKIGTSLTNRIWIRFTRFSKRNITFICKDYQEFHTLYEYFKKTEYNLFVNKDWRKGYSIFIGIEDLHLYVTRHTILELDDEEQPRIQEFANFLVATKGNPNITVLVSTREIKDDSAKIRNFKEGNSKYYFDYGDFKYDAYSKSLIKEFFYRFQLIPDPENDEDVFEETVDDISNRNKESLVFIGFDLISALSETIKQLNLLTEVGRNELSILHKFVLEFISKSDTNLGSYRKFFFETLQSNRSDGSARDENMNKRVNNFVAGQINSIVFNNQEIKPLINEDRIGTLNYTFRLHALIVTSSIDEIPIGIDAIHSEFGSGLIDKILSALLNAKEIEISRNNEKDILSYKIHHSEVATKFLDCYHYLSIKDNFDNLQKEKIAVNKLTEILSVYVFDNTGVTIMGVNIYKMKFKGYLKGKIESLTLQKLYPEIIKERIDIMNPPSKVNKGRGGLIDHNLLQDNLPSFRKDWGIHQPPGKLVEPLPFYYINLTKKHYYINKGSNQPDILDISLCSDQEYHNTVELARKSHPYETRNVFAMKKIEEIKGRIKLTVELTPFIKIEKTTKEIYRDAFNVRSYERQIGSVFFKNQKDKNFHPFLNNEFGVEILEDGKPRMYDTRGVPIGIDTLIVYKKEEDYYFLYRHRSYDKDAYPYYLHVQGSGHFEPFFINNQRDLKDDSVLDTLSIDKNFRRKYIELVCNLTDSELKQHDSYSAFQRFQDAEFKKLDQLLELDHGKSKKHFLTGIAWDIIDIHPVICTLFLIKDENWITEISDVNIRSSLQNDKPFQLENSDILYPMKFYENTRMKSFSDIYSQLNHQHPDIPMVPDGLATIYLGLKKLSTHKGLIK